KKEPEPAPELSASPSFEPESTDRVSETPVEEHEEASAASATSKPEPVEDAHEPAIPVQDDQEIVMPQDELEPHDPFKSAAMFDSVRRMESEIPDLENAETMLGVPRAVETPQRKEPEVQNEKPDPSGEVQHTASGMGDTDTDGRKSAKLKPLS